MNAHTPGSDRHDNIEGLAGASHQASSVASGSSGGRWRGVAIASAGVLAVAALATAAYAMPEGTSPATNGQDGTGAGDGAGTAVGTKLNAEGDTSGAPESMCAAELVVNGRTYTLYDQSSLGDAKMAPGPSIGTGTIPPCSDTPGPDVQAEETTTVKVYSVKGASTSEAVISGGEVWVPLADADEAVPGGVSPSLTPSGMCATEVEYDGRTYSQVGGTDANVRKGRLLGTAAILPCQDTNGAGEASDYGNDMINVVKVYKVKGMSLSEGIYVAGHGGYAWAPVE